MQVIVASARRLFVLPKRKDSNKRQLLVVCATPNSYIETHVGLRVAAPVSMLTLFIYLFFITFYNLFYFIFDLFLQKHSLHLCAVAIYVAAAMLWQVGN